MFKGSVEAIFIGKERRKPMERVRQISVVETHGIEGDRFYRSDKAALKADHRGREVTLIESEALAGLKEEYCIDLKPEETRRNILTKDVPLNHLVGKEFSVGEARLKGVRLCEPCEHLEGMTQPKVLEGLSHRGGLRAQIIKSGAIKTGDEIAE